MDTPSISVVMSVFNGQDFLSEAIESILTQTFRDFEFVVIDDGSTDRTPEILSSYASRDARMVVLRHENKGRTASLNVGIGVAKAPYIARMDADDVSMPHRLQAQFDFLERHAEVGLLGGAVDVINTTRQVILKVCFPLEDAEIKLSLLRENPMCHSAVVMRKEVALAAGGYRESFSESEDYDLWLRISERSRLANLVQPIVKYRIHTGQVSVRNWKNQALCFLAARAAAKFRKRGSPDPLAGVDEITPQLLDTLGVTQADTLEIVDLCQHRAGSVRVLYADFKPNRPSSDPHSE
jgi:glycosyltransferase involved in cell wall biosynthesis